MKIARLLIFSLATLIHLPLFSTPCGPKIDAAIGKGFKTPLARAEMITYSRPDNNFGGEHIAKLPADKRDGAIALLCEADTLAAQMLELTTDPQKHPPSAKRDERLTELASAYDAKMAAINELMPSLSDNDYHAKEGDEWNRKLEIAKIEGRYKNRLTDQETHDRIIATLKTPPRDHTKELSFLKFGDPIIVVGKSGSRRQGTFISFSSDREGLNFNYGGKPAGYLFNNLNLDLTIEATKTEIERAKAQPIGNNDSTVVDP